MTTLIKVKEKTKTEKRKSNKRKKKTYDAASKKMKRQTLEKLMRDYRFKHGTMSNVILNLRGLINHWSIAQFVI